MSSMPTTEEALDISNSDQAIQVKQSSIQNEMCHKSLIGKAVFIKGELAAREDMLVDGRLEGSVTLKNNRLEIGVTGCIQADAYARVIVINGEMKGDVYARDQVTVTKTGRVYGNIFAGDINIEDGALLKGSINMDMQDVIRDHFSEEGEDEDENKSSTFGFLFSKKSKALPQLDSEGNDASHNAHTEDSSPVTFIPNQSAMLERSLIGRSVVIKGQIEADEDVIIQGEVDGIIHFKNNNLEIGLQAKICANVFVNSLVTYGDIKGDVYANEHVALKKPAHVFGTVRSPRVSIESGAVLMGNIEMEQQDIEKIFANVDVAAITKPKISHPEKPVHEDDKVTTVAEDQYTVSKQTYAVKADRVPWPE